MDGVTVNVRKQALSVIVAHVKVQIVALSMSAVPL